MKQQMLLEIDYHFLLVHQSQGPDRSSVRITRTMSDESLHNFKATPASQPMERNVSDVLFTVAPPVPALPKEVLKDQRWVSR